MTTLWVNIRMKQAIVGLLVALHCLFDAAAQSTLAEAAGCVPDSGITALINCDKMRDETAKCDDSKPEDFTNCYCRQDLFNLIFE
jgi:hypothetical protein